MQRIHLILTLLLLSAGLLHAQEDEKERLDERIDKVTYQWDLEADKLATYEGLLVVCTDKPYRMEIISLLNEIHHLDSVLYDVLVELSRVNTDKEIRKTIKEIEQFENEYDTKSFIHFMSKECKASKEIEKDSEDSRNSVGERSYSGQVYILET
ncbi:MAG: hypothetical protein AAF551_14340, partial [Bacteroidota bacterium]